MQAEAKGLREDEGQRKERRRVDKFITLQVQQISATQQQARHLALSDKLLSSVVDYRSTGPLCAHGSVLQYVAGFASAMLSCSGSCAARQKSSLCAASGSPLPIVISCKQEPRPSAQQRQLSL